MANCKTFHRGNHKQNFKENMYRDLKHESRFPSLSLSLSLVLPDKRLKELAAFMKCEKSIFEFTEALYFFVEISNYDTYRERKEY